MGPGLAHLIRKQEVLSRNRAVLTLSAVVFGLGLAAVISALLIYDRLAEESRLSSTALWGEILFFGLILAVANLLVAMRPESRYYRREQPEEVLLRRIEFAEKTSTDLTSALAIKGFSLSKKRSIELERRPITDVDVHRELEELIQAVGRPVVIAIDELDKMDSDEDAIRFLNRIKPLFQAAQCSFIVSISESAWARFERRGLPGRDAFDSSFDEVVHIAHMTPIQSVELLTTRTKEISVLQALACHCLSGGLARELLRSARRLAAVALTQTEPTLSSCLNEVVCSELRNRSRAMPLSVWLDLPSGTALLRSLEQAMSDPGTGNWRRLKETALRLPPTTNSSRVQSLTSVQIASSLVALGAILLTTRDAFTSLGPTSRLSAENPLTRSETLDGLRLLGEARIRLEHSAATAWPIIHASRAKLGLAELWPLATADVNDELIQLLLQDDEVMV